MSAPSFIEYDSVCRIVARRHRNCCNYSFDAVCCVCLHKQSLRTGRSHAKGKPEEGQRASTHSKPRLSGASPSGEWHDVDGECSVAPPE